MPAESPGSAGRMVTGYVSAGFLGTFMTHVSGCVAGLSGDWVSGPT